MKIALCTILSILALHASADSFTIIQGGKTYLCQEQNASVNPLPETDCVQIAMKDSKFTRNEALVMCHGVYTTGAGECAQKMVGYGAKEQALAICTGALLDGPADCFHEMSKFMEVEKTNGQKINVYFEDIEAVSYCERTGTKKFGLCAADALSRQARYDQNFEVYAEDKARYKQNAINQCLHE